MAHKECPYCNKLLRPNNYKRHINSCQREKKNTLKIEDDWKISENEYKCPHCGKIYSKSGIATHIWRNHISNNKNWGGGPQFKGQKGIKPWNSGLTKDTDERILNSSNTFKKNNPNGLWLGKHHSIESKKRISEKLSINNKGGRCKWYKTQNPKGVEFNVQGTWELKFTKVLNFIDEDWIKIGIGKEEHSFRWIDSDNNIHTYTPDFWSPKLQKYFEIKGYLRKNDAIKMEYILKQNSNVNIEIVKKNELNQYLKLFNINEFV